MPLPTSITDLSTVPGSNSPLGNEPPTQGDDHIRYLAAIVRQVYDAQGGAIVTNIDGTYASYSTLGDAITAIGSTRCTVIVRDDITMSASATFPATATLSIENGARITTTGYALTAKIMADQSQHFAGTGTVTLLPGSQKAVPQWWGAVGDGTTNDTSAFTAARTASGGRYHLPGGLTYLVDASPDVWDDLFTADAATNIKIGVTTYDVSNAFAGPWRWAAGSDVLLNLRHAVTGNDVMQLQAGSSGQATYFQRTVAIACDSHHLIAQPATNGGSTDFLVRRSSANADPAGNRFNMTFDEANDRWLFSYATTASGFPSFDSFMRVYAGTSASMDFPALRPTFNKGWRVKQVASGGFELELEQTSSTVATLKQIGGAAQEYMHFRDGAMGFFGSTGTSRPTITGSRGGNAALADLLTWLATLGLITNSTTA